jgi:LacI family transcriptional regulator, galactose operon repressor
MRKPPTKKRPTQADVARIAGVSQAMVSYVLNNNAAISVSTDTWQRILDAIEEVGYVPDNVARSLRTRKTYTLACVIPDITNPFHPVFAQGIQHVAEQYGYDLILYNTERLAEREQKVLRSLQQRRVDGVIITALHLSAEDLVALVETDIPVVVQGSAMPVLVRGFPLDSLYVNNIAAARTAVSFLIGREHTRIGMIAGQKDTPPRHDRVLGYRQALEQHGIPIDERLILDSDFKEEGGYRSAKLLLELSPRPTAIFAASDLMAVGAMVAIKEAGLRIPDDIAIVGFDDIPIAKLVNPALTTVAQFQEKLGQRAAEMLFERLNGTAPETGYCEEMPYELIVRESA